MNQVVVYWSQTGNTEEIANKIKDDLNCDIFSVSEANINDIANYDLIILGSPAMGNEELEDSEFRPFFNELMAALPSNKKIALFGSYGWGDGEWMRNWVDEVKGYGLNLLNDGLIVNGGADSIIDSEYDSFISSLK